MDEVVVGIGESGEAHCTLHGCALSEKEVRTGEQDLALSSDGTAGRIKCDK